MDAWVWGQIGLKLSEINVEGAIETKGRGQGGDDLSDETIEIGVGGTLDVQVTTADVVQGLVVDLVGDVGGLQKGLDAQDGVVGLDDSGGNLGAGPHGEGDLGLLAVVNTEALHHQRTKTGSGTATDGVVDHEALETGALVGQLTNAIEDKVDNLLTDGVVTTGVVVGGIFLTGDQLLGMEQLTISSGADLVNDGGLEIDEDGTGDMLAGAGLTEEGVEGIITTANGLVGGHLTIGLDAVLEAEEFPASVTDLATGLTDVQTESFTHIESSGGLVV